MILAMRRQVSIQHQQAATSERSIPLPPTAIRLSDTKPLQSTMLCALETLEKYKAWGLSLSALHSGWEEKMGIFGNSSLWLGILTAWGAEFVDNVW